MYLFTGLHVSNHSTNDALFYYELSLSKQPRKDFYNSNSCIKYNMDDKHERQWKYNMENKPQTRPPNIKTENIMFDVFWQLRFFSTTSSERNSAQLIR